MSDVIEGAVLLLALCIAFNSTAINMDERARENATMFAYGLPAGRVLLVSVVESLIIGLLDDRGPVPGPLGGCAGPGHSPRPYIGWVPSTSTC